MNLLEKLLAIQQGIDQLFKDDFNEFSKYSYVSSEAALRAIRPLMNEYKLLLEPCIRSHKMERPAHDSKTVFTELEIDFVWIDVETGETRVVPFYAQGTDTSGEKGVGKALTYAEKYFLLKYFHIPTEKDDPDNGKNTGKNTNSNNTNKNNAKAQKELAQQYRAQIMIMLNELFNNDAEKIKAALVSFTGDKEKGIQGVDDINKANDLALKAYHTRIKNKYVERLNKQPVFN